MMISLIGFQDIFQFYVPLSQFNERDKLLELRSALEEGSSAQRAFDFLELLALGSFPLAVQRLSERFRCMLTPEALRVEFSRLQLKSQQTIQEFATEVEQMAIRTFPHKSPMERDSECCHQFRVGLGDEWAYKLLNCPDLANFHQTLRWVLERSAKQESIRTIRGPRASAKYKREETESKTKQQAPTTVGQTRRRMEMFRSQKGAAPLKPRVVEPRTLRCWKCNQEGHTQHTYPKREGNSNTPRYTQQQLSVEKKVAREEAETKQHYAERMRDMAQQVELEALQERLSKARTGSEVQTNALTVVEANALKVQQETESSETVPVTGGTYLLDLYVGGFHVKNALVDTGSPATIVSEKLLTEILTFNSKLTPAFLTKPEVQLVDCGHHPLRIVGQIPLTLGLDTEGTGRKVKVLIGADCMQTCLQGANAHGIALVLSIGDRVPRSSGAVQPGPFVTAEEPAVQPWQRSPLLHRYVIPLSLSGWCRRAESRDTEEQPWKRELMEIGVEATNQPTYMSQTENSYRNLSLMLRVPWSSLPKKGQSQLGSTTSATP